MKCCDEKYLPPQEPREIIWSIICKKLQNCIQTRLSYGGYYCEPQD